VGTDGYYQPVKLIARRTLENDSRLALFNDSKSEALSFERDAYFVNRISQAPEVDAPLVFVGWGLDIPEKGYNDLQGADVKGKLTANSCIARCNSTNAVRISSERTMKRFPSRCASATKIVRA
jgi:hypothetical protein